MYMYMYSWDHGVILKTGHICILTGWATVPSTTLSLEMWPNVIIRLGFQ